MNMGPTKYLNSNSREDELIIVHYATDESIDFERLFKAKGTYKISKICLYQIINITYKLLVLN